MNEFERELLSHLRAQSTLLQNLERATAEQGRTLHSILVELRTLNERSAPISMARRLRLVENEVSELQGVTARHAAQLAHGGGNG